jgi:hypothetical protein
VLGSEPLGIQLRYLQTLAEIAGERNSTTIFPVPIDLIRPLLELQSQGGAGGGAGGPGGGDAPAQEGATNRLEEGSE